MKMYKAILTLFGLTTLTTACGNFAGSANPYSVGNSYYSYTGSGYSSDSWTVAQQCSENANIIEQGTSDHRLDLHACSSGGNSAKLFPSDGTNHAICVFPLRNTGYGSIPFSSSTPRGYNYVDQYLYQCVNAGPQGASISFGVTFNSVYVVEQTDLQTFGACLAYGNLAPCAAQAGVRYAYGSF